MFTWKPFLIYLLFSAVGLAVKIFPPLNIELDEGSMFDAIYKDLDIELPPSTSAENTGTTSGRSSRSLYRSSRISSLSDKLQETPDGAKRLIQFMVDDVGEILQIGNFGIQAAWEKHMGDASKNTIDVYEQLEILRKEILDHSDLQHHMTLSWRESKIKALSDLEPTEKTVSLAVDFHTLLIAWRTSHYYQTMTRDLAVVRSSQPTKRESAVLSYAHPPAVSDKRVDLNQFAYDRIDHPEDLKKVLLSISSKPPYLERSGAFVTLGNLHYWFESAMMSLFLDRSMTMAYHAKTEIFDKNWGRLREVFKDQDVLYFIDIYGRNIDYSKTHKWNDLFNYYNIIQWSLDKCMQFVVKTSNQLLRSYLIDNPNPIDKTERLQVMEKFKLQAFQIALQNVGLAINHVDDFFRQIRGQEEEVIFIPQTPPPQKTIDDLVDSAARYIAAIDDLLTDQLSPVTLIPSRSTEKLWEQIMHLTMIMYRNEQSKHMEDVSHPSYMMLKERLKEAKIKLNEEVTLQDPPSDAEKQSTYDSAVNSALDEFEKTILFSSQKVWIAYDPNYSEMWVQAVKNLFSSVSASQVEHFKNKITVEAHGVERESLVFRIYHYIFQLNTDQRLHVFQRIENQLKGLKQKSSLPDENFEKLNSLYQLIKTNAQGLKMEWREEMVYQDPQCPLKEIYSLWKIVEKEADHYLPQVESGISSWSEPDWLSLNDLSEETRKRLESVPKIMKRGEIRSEMRCASSLFSPRKTRSN